MGKQNVQAEKVYWSKKDQRFIYAVRKNGIIFCKGCKTELAIDQRTDELIAQM